MKCCQSRPHNLYREQSHTSFSKANCLYFGSAFFILISFAFFLRDTTPVIFVKPTISDMLLDQADSVVSTKLNDVYWRVSIRHINDMLKQVCKQETYMVLTNKNIKSDKTRMKENYIYFCNPISNIQSMINARIVLSKSATNQVRCKETYGTKTKTVIRHYPFSLKYIDATSFANQQTKIIRTGKEACTVLHALDVVNSVWD